MTHAVVVGAAPAAAEEAFYRALLGSFDLVVAADAAGEWCVSLGRVPDIVIGDFDSAADGAADRLQAAGAHVIRLSRDKDVSDLDAAVEVAIDRGATAVTLTAAFTGRVDHTLSAFGSLSRAAARASAGARDPGWSATVATPDRRFEADLAVGTLFSVLSPTGAGGVTITGASFPLDGHDLGSLSSRGVSNEALGGTVRVSVTLGVVMVVVMDEAVTS
jgi:thiamine pyrophosphokinase